VRPTTVIIPLGSGFGTDEGLGVGVGLGVVVGLGTCVALGVVVGLGVGVGLAVDEGVGLGEEIGARLPVTVKLLPLLVPAEVVTRTSSSPMAMVDGTTQTILPAAQLTYLAHCIMPNLTRLPPRLAPKRLPLRVNLLPGLPLVRESLVR
jgi:hypothetical protein